MISTMNIRHDDDFKISVNFVGEDGTPLNNSEVKFNFVYQDCEDNKYEVSFDGTTRLNNVVKDNRIVIIFNANTFQRGQLSVTRRYQVDDSDFNDGVWNYSSSQGSELIDVIII